ncbi:PTPRS-like protein, partial [Mya arenaria]
MEICHFVVVLCLMFVQAQIVLAQECSTCKYASCTSRGYCYNGCIDGYYGNNCIYKCITPNCKSCHQSYGRIYCSQCKYGYYLKNNICHNCGSQCKLCSIYSCQSCYDGYWGNTCENNCYESCASCSKSNGYCFSCEPGYYVHNGNCYPCDTHCAVCSATLCTSCRDGYWGNKCENSCTGRCSLCQKSNGGCLSCKPGYMGSTCDDLCVEYCLECDRLNGNCISCDKSHWGYACDACNVQCKICNQSNGCLECNVGYYGQTCDKDCGVYCQNCDRINGCLQCLPGYYKHNNMCAECSYRSNGCTCTSNVQCSGCVYGYFLNPSLCSKCPEYCSNCNKSLSGQTVCTSCTAGTFGETCQYICSQDCENGYCDEKNPDETCSQCANGRFGEKCEHFCSLGCESRNCTKETGSCTCKAGWNVIQTKPEKQTTPTALGGVIGCGIVALSAIVFLALFLFRRRKVNLSNKSKTNEKEPENPCALYATVNKGRVSTAEYTFGDSNNMHSVTIIKSPNSPPNRSGVETTHIFIEDNLEIDEDDASAREFAVIFEENGGVYYNNAEKFRTIKLPVTGLPQYVLNIRLKDLEEEFQKIPYGLVKSYEVSQMTLNMHSNRYKGIYPYDDSRGFRRRNAYIATLGPMAKQLGDFGQFWRMIWQQDVEKIVMVTNLVEGENIKCEQYWPDHHQSKLYDDIEVVCKVEKLYADYIWRQFTLSQNSEERSLHHLQFTSWPDKDIPDDVTSIIELRQRVSALPSTLNGPVVVH